MSEYKTESCSNATPDSHQVIETLAEHVDKDPVEVDFTFNDHINPDALDKLLETDTEEVIVEFSVENMSVTVSSDGTIRIDDQE